MDAGGVALWVIIMLVLLALAFDFMNGFHDAANSIATVVSTGVLKPGQAVLFAAFFNFVAIFVFQLSVATTVGKGIVDAGVVDTHVIFGALIGAIAWNIITWYYGIPSSSSHALIDRRHRGCGGGEGRRLNADRRGNNQNRNIHICRALPGISAGIWNDDPGFLAVPAIDALARGSMVSSPAIVFGRRVQPRPWWQ